MTAKKTTAKETAAEEPPVTEEKNQVIMGVPEPQPERLSVSSGKEVFSPVPYFTFEVGGATIWTDIRETETYEDAMERCRTFLEAQTQAQFEAKMEGFFSRLGTLDAYMEEKGMQSRNAKETFGRGSSTPAPAQNQGPANEAGFYGDPKVGDRQSPAQATMLEHKAQDAGMDLDTQTERIFGCKPHELNRKAASKMIDWLMAQAKPGGGSFPTHSGGPGEQARMPIDNPIARSLSDLVTANQLGMIRALAREKGLDADKESQEKFRCKVDELSKRAASELIDHLKQAEPGYDQTPPGGYDGEQAPSSDFAPPASADDDIPF